MRIPTLFLLLPLALAACDETAMVSMAPNNPTQLSVPDTAHYAAVEDQGFAVPAIPVDQVPAEFLRQPVRYQSDLPVGSVVIDPSSKHLYLITAKNQALRYGIAVGRTGFGWSGEAVITSRTTWPTWTPPPEMIARSPKYAKYAGGQPGGLSNPLGARALYLTTNGVDYGYRIHGTPEWDSIGHNASSGCFRMMNQDVMDLYGRVQDGAKVVVLNEDGSFPTKLTMPKPQPKKAKPAEPETVAAPAPAPAAPTSGPI